MNELTYIVIGLVFVFGIAFLAVSIYSDLRKVKKRAINKEIVSVSDHKIINQRIQIDEKKFVDLEIRVKILEDER